MHRHLRSRTSKHPLLADPFNILPFHQIPSYSLSLYRYKKKHPTLILRHTFSNTFLPSRTRSRSLTSSLMLFLQLFFSSALVLFLFLLFHLYLPLTFRDTFFFTPCSSPQNAHPPTLRMSHTDRAINRPTTAPLRLITHCFLGAARRVHRLRLFFDFFFPLHQLRTERALSTR